MIERLASSTLSRMVTAMSFWEDVYELREKGLIPRVWKRSDLTPLLQKPNGSYAEGSINTIPSNASISLEHIGMGNYVKNRQLPKAWRVGTPRSGQYQLVEDPEDDAATQKEQREKAVSRAKELRAMSGQEIREPSSLPSKQLLGVIPSPQINSSQDLAEKLQDAQHLIVGAYQQAHRSGKQDWCRMTAAVLKNRLLDLTGRSFDEAQYGASSFMDFVSRYPNMLQVDVSVFPPIVELRGTEAARLSSAGNDYTPTAYYVRSDLWQAVLDYSSGTTYVWDLDTKEARPIRDFDPSPTIDPVTADLQRQWRQEFLDEVRHALELTHMEVSQTNEWIRLQLGTPRLPTRLIPRWNRLFRDKVRDHIRGWFSESGLEPPGDMVSSSGRRSADSSCGREDLRELVISVVRKMTREELSGLSLPIEAVLRATRQSKP